MAPRKSTRAAASPDLAQHAHPASKPLATPQVFAPLAEDSVWQNAHDTLQTAFDAGNVLFNQLPFGDPRRTLTNNALDLLSDELTALNQESMHDRTISLKAAAQQLGAGMAHLKALQQQLAEIAADIAEAAKVVTAIDNALTGLQSFLATLPAL